MNLPNESSHNGQPQAVTTIRLLYNTLKASASLNTHTTTGYEPKRYRWVFLLFLTYSLWNMVGLKTTFNPRIVVRLKITQPLTPNQFKPLPFNVNCVSNSEPLPSNSIDSQFFTTASQISPHLLSLIVKAQRCSEPEDSLKSYQVPLLTTMKINTPFSTPTKAAALTLSGDTATVNGITFTAKKSRDFELGAFADTVTPKYRESLGGKNLFEFRNEAVSPLSPAFTLETASIRITDDTDFFGHNNKVMMQLFNLKGRLTSYCMQSMFQVLPIDPASGDLDETKPTVDLLSSACTISEGQVRLSNQVYAENTSEKIHPQNLSWSQELLLGSCESTLCSDIEHRLISIPQNEQGGPLILHMILNQMMSTTHEAARNIVRRLESHKVTDYPGENIPNFCATYNNAIMRLNVSGHVPKDVANIFFIQLQTCTVPKLLGFLDNLENSDDAILQDFVALRERVILKYNDLLLADKWLPTSSSDSSSFTSKKTLSDSKKSSSNNGGKSGGGRTCLPIDTTPPGEGEPNWRPHPLNGDKKIWWCALCPNGTDNGVGRWGNHSTSRHDPTKVRARRQNTPSTPAAASNTTTSDDSDATVADSTSPPSSSTQTGTIASVSSLRRRDF